MSFGYGFGFGLIQATVDSGILGTVVYDIKLADMTPSDSGTGGFVCFITGTEEGYSPSPFQISWNSLGGGSASSVTVDIYRTYNDGFDITGLSDDLLLNTVSVGSNSTTKSDCLADVISFSISPAAYVVGGANVFEWDYQGGAGAALEVDVNPSWGIGTDIYARVTVLYV